MPTYEIEYNGKIYEVDSDKELSDADILKAAGRLDTPQVSTELLKMQPSYKPKFGERVRREFDRLQGGAAEAHFEPSKQAHREMVEGFVLDDTGPLDAAAGAGEVALATVTAPMAAVMAGYGGLKATALELLKNRGTEMGAALERGGESATRLMDYRYHPKTPRGKALTQLLLSPFTLANDAAGAVGASIGRVAGDENLGQTLGEAVVPAGVVGMGARSVWKARPHDIPPPPAAPPPVANPPAVTATGKKVPALLQKPKEGPHKANPPEQAGTPPSADIPTGAIENVLGWAFGKKMGSKLAGKALAHLLMSESKPKVRTSKFDYMTPTQVSPAFMMGEDSADRDK